MGSSWEGLPGSNSGLWGHLQDRGLGAEGAAQGYAAAKASQSLLQRLSLLLTLDSHRGCVNSVVWNDGGSLLLSGSDDHRLVVTEPHTKRVVADVETAHRANIFSAKFLPGSGDSKIVSCAGDGTLLYTDLNRQDATHRCLFSCHSGTSYEIQTMPESAGGDPHTFLSCGEDGTVRWFDLRTKQRCECRRNSGGGGGRGEACRDDVLASVSSPVTSISLHPLLPFYLAAGSSDSAVRIFDRRMLSLSSSLDGRSDAAVREKTLEALVARFTVPEFAGKNKRITSVQYRPDGREILASYSSDYVYIFNPTENDVVRPKKLYVGRRPGLEGDGPDRGKSLSSSSASGGAGTEKGPPPMKRIRLRGDWSDTGPNARPEGETSPARTPSADASAAPEVEPEGAAGGRSEHAAAPRPGNEADGRGGGAAEAAAPQSRRTPLRTPQQLALQRRLLQHQQQDQRQEQQQQQQGEDEDEAGLQGNLMQRMTDALSRMLNDPSTRLAMQRLQSSRGEIERAAADRDQQPQQPEQPEQQPQPSSEESEATANSSGNGNSENTAVGASATAAGASGGTVSSDPGSAGRAEEPTGGENLGDAPSQVRRRSAPPETRNSSGAGREEPQGPGTSSNSGAQTGDDGEEEAVVGEAENIDSIRDSINTMREDYVGRHNSEPLISLRYRSQGVESSTISMSRPEEAEAAAAAAAAAASDVDDEEPQGERDQGDGAEEGDADRTSPPREDSQTRQRAEEDEQEIPSQPLPGPSQVVTHPGDSSTNPVTGQRQRRRGVSGPPTGPSVSAPSDADADSGPEPNIYEFEDENDDLLAAGYDDEEEPEEEDEDEEDESEEVGEGPRKRKKTLRHPRLITQPPVRQRFIGHRNARTMIKEACWWGTDFVLSGSDCGHIFGWRRDTGRLVLLLEADRHVVNCVRPHPFDPVLASSGIDYNVKLWAPTKEEPEFNQEAADMLVRRNEVMLEETRDTITVPATLMIRMLASLNQIRRVGRLLPHVLERRRERGAGQRGNSQEGAIPGGGDREQEAEGEEQREERPEPEGREEGEEEDA